MSLAGTEPTTAVPVDAVVSTDYGIRRPSGVVEWLPNPSWDIDAAELATPEGRVLANGAWRARVEALGIPWSEDLALTFVQRIVWTFPTIDLEIEETP